MAEGETLWRLLSLEEPLGVVWLRWSAGCDHGALVEFLLCRRVALLPWLDRRGGNCRGHCVVVDPLDACSLVLGSILPHVVGVRCCAESVGVCLILYVVIIDVPTLLLT
jgi:hypothetical protein